MVEIGEVAEKTTKTKMKANDPEEDTKLENFAEGNKCMLSHGESFYYT